MMTNPDEVKDKFYNDFDDVISAKPRTDYPSLATLMPEPVQTTRPGKKL